MVHETSFIKQYLLPKKKNNKNASLSRRVLEVWLKHVQGWTQPGNH